MDKIQYNSISSSTTVFEDSKFIHFRNKESDINATYILSNLTDKPTPGVNGKEVLVSLEDNRPSEKLIVPVGE